MSVAIKVNPPASRSGTRRSGGRRPALWTVYTLAVLLVVVLLVDGYSYYATPYKERPYHPDYRELRPAGSRGLVFGIIGTSMMVLMLIYTLQKRLRLFGRRLPLRPFLDIHIFFGVIGPLFILLHTSFKVQGLVAIAFWSMVAVALSGYLGRYLYQQIPRNMDNKELSLGEIEATGKQLLEEIRQRTGLDDAVLADIISGFEDAYTTRAKSLWQLLPGLILRDLKRPWLKRRLHRKIARLCRLSRRQVNMLITLGTRRALLRRRLIVLEKVRQLFHWWHVIHKPFAIIMYLIMGVHIGVAIWTGYAWY